MKAGLMGALFLGILMILFGLSTPHVSEIPSSQVPGIAQPSSDVTALPTDPSGVSTATPASPALAAARALPVKGRAPHTGYSRSQFGAAWMDFNNNGCDTRNDILRRDFTQVIIKPNTGGCKVIGGHWVDPYSGVPYVFDHQPSEIDGDHVVSLSNAWQTGAAQWDLRKRESFANDPLNIVMTAAALNREKSDSDAASWLPPDKSFRCAFIARQVAVKKKYGLWVTASEKATMVRILSAKSCARTKLPTPTQRPV